MHQQVWVIEGAIDISVGDERHSARRRRLRGHGAGQAHHVPQPAQDRRALRRGARVHALPLAVPEIPWRPAPQPLPLKSAVSPRCRRGRSCTRSPTCSIDCVEGGASVSFMLPMTRDKRTRVLAPGGRRRRARRARAAGGRGRARHRGHRAGDPRPTREPAAPRRRRQDAGAPARASPGRWARR